MNQRTFSRTPEQMIEEIFGLDLDAIKFKLMDTKEGHGWTREEADRHELEYRRFLALIAKYPDEAITPDTNVDKFWHGHILDTMKYAEDCQQIFGYYLHHFPYFGMRGDEDAANLAEAAARTRSLYHQEFGHPGAEEGSYCARMAEFSSAYCARTVNSKGGVSESGAAYCARATPADVPDASYCARVVATAEPDVAYCARVAALQSSYCARVVEADASYCARGAILPGADGQIYGTTGTSEATPAYLAKVLAKGRPTLSPSDSR